MDVLLLAIGFITGVGTSFVFYLLARADAELATWRSQMFLAILRLKLMTPTYRHRVVGGFGVSESENYLTCLSETLRIGGWVTGADALDRVVADMQNLPHYESPDETQRTKGESHKKEFEAHLTEQINELHGWSSKLRASVSSWALGILRR